MTAVDATTLSHIQVSGIPPSLLASQPLRFLVNGLMATFVHFLVLIVCYRMIGLPSAGVSNAIAAIAGVSVSFLGNRHFVFQATRESAWTQLSRFWGLYVALTLMQGALLFAWSDIAGLDYRMGFMIGVALQAVCTYYGGRHWVFK